MRVSLFMLVSIFTLIGAVQQAGASGSPGNLAEFCRRAEYIVVAECVDQVQSEAKLKVEIVHKAPQANPEPEFLDVKGMYSTATRFSFQKEKRYFAFVFKDGYCTSRGSHFEIAKDGSLSRFLAIDLICLERDTNTLNKLTQQVKRVLSGEYDKELIERIGNKELSYDARRRAAMALSKTNPEGAVELITTLLIEISREERVEGSSRDLYMKLLSLDPGRARDISLQILSNTDVFQLYSEASEVLSQPQCKIEDFQKCYPMLVKAADEWEKVNYHCGYTYMLSVFVNNDCRLPEVKRMLLAKLSSPEMGYFDRISQVAIKLQFSESLPLFWNQIKKKRQVSNLVNLETYIAGHVGSTTIWGREPFEKMEVWMTRNLVGRTFSKYAKNIAEAEAVRVNNSLLFLVSLDDGEKHACIYVGFIRDDQGRYRHRVFILFGKEYLVPSRRE